jgi:HicB family
VPERVPCKRVLIRLPVSLHDQIGLAAASEGVSLNQFVCAVLASAVQWRSQAGEGAESRYPKTREEYGRQMWADLLR